MEFYISQIIMMANNFAPQDFMPCDGRLLQISQYQALYSLLGTTYGGDGKTNFALPNLINCVPIMTNKDINSITTDHADDISIKTVKIQYFIAVNGMYPNRA